MEHTEKCIYCGAMTDCRDYILNPKASHELPCCSEACYNKSKTFVTWDNKWRMKYYLLLLVLVVANLLFFGFMPDTRWKYLPMLGIGVLSAILPLVFARYDRYQAFGIKRSTIVIRVIATALTLFAAILIVMY